MVISVANGMPCHINANSKLWIPKFSAGNGIISYNVCTTMGSIIILLLLLACNTCELQCVVIPPSQKVPTAI